MEKGALRRTLAMACLSALGFLVTAGALHLLPKDDIRLYAEHRSEKLAMMDEMNGSANVAAFGTSHVHCGFDPRAFDAKIPGIHSVNLAVQGGSQTEQRAMALAYLRSMKASGKRPRLLILELNAGANFTPQFLCHPRNINIADLGNLAFAKTLASKPLPTKQRVGRFGMAAMSTGMYVANVGIVSNWIFRHDLNAAVYEEDTGDDRRGVERGIASPGQTADVQRVFAQPADPKPTEAAIVEGNRRLVDDLVAAARALFGSEGVPSFAYVVAPHTDDRMTIVHYPEGIETSVGVVPILDAARIDRYPDLYQPVLWLDSAHVNAAGAVRLTQIVADEIVRRSPNAVR